ANPCLRNRAHALLRAHSIMEQMSDNRPGRLSIGTPSRGIGPCYEDKAARLGVRVADLLDRDYFHAHYDSVMEEKSAIAKTFGIFEALDFHRIREDYEAFAERIRPMVRDTCQLLNQAIRD